MKRTLPTPECAALGDLLIAFSVDELDPERKAQVQMHLDLCARCREELAEFKQAAQLAESLQLTSPVVDRYPEFLRRLAVSESKPSSQALLPLTELSALDTEPGSIPLTEGGFAAVVPIFGRRLAVRTGFQRGFDLTLQGRGGNQLLRISAVSLTRVATVAAGFSAVAALAVVVMILTISPGLWRTSSPPPPGGGGVLGGIEPDSVFPKVKAVGIRPPLVSSSTETSTLMAWNASGKVQAQFVTNNQLTGQPIDLRLQPEKQTKSTQGFENTPAIATDGTRFLVISELDMGICAWRLNPGTTGSDVYPITLTQRGVQPAVVWIGDRYLAAWTVPDISSPKIEMVELGSDGRLLTKSPKEVALSLNGNKLRNPVLAGDKNQMVLAYFTQDQRVHVQLWQLNAAGPTPPQHIVLPTSEQTEPVHLKIIPRPNEFDLFWIEHGKPDGSEIKFARLTRTGELSGVKTLVVSTINIPEFDLRETATDFKLVWLETSTKSAVVLMQHIDLTGERISQPLNLPTENYRALSTCFADPDGTSLVWFAHRPGEAPSFFVASNLP